MGPDGDDNPVGIPGCAVYYLPVRWGAVNSEIRP